MKKNLNLRLLSMSLVIAPIFSWGAHYTVEVRNVTRGQGLSPFVFVAHGAGFALYELGRPASEGVWRLAEDGHTSYLVKELEKQSLVKTVTVGSGIQPGREQTSEIEVEDDDYPVHHQTFLSLISMLAQTNDGFAGGSGLKLPETGSVSYELRAYDAGSEVNNESCKYVPAPPCNSHNARMPMGAEGYVTAHTGILGVGDLKPLRDGFANPVAIVKITKN